MSNPEIDPNQDLGNQPPQGQEAHYPEDNTMQRILVLGGAAMMVAVPAGVMLIGAGDTPENVPVPAESTQKSNQKVNDRVVVEGIEGVDVSFPGLGEKLSPGDAELSVEKIVKLEPSVFTEHQTKEEHKETSNKIIEAEDMPEAVSILNEDMDIDVRYIHNPDHKSLTSEKNIVASDIHNTISKIPTDILNAAELDGVLIYEGSNVTASGADIIINASKGNAVEAVYQGVAGKLFGKLSEEDQEAFADGDTLSDALEQYVDWLDQDPEGEQAPLESTSSALLRVLHERGDFSPQ